MKKKSIFGFSLWVSLVAALGGILFGYHTSVIAGAMLFLSEEFLLTSFQEGLLVSSLLAGALLGSLVGGELADKWGRKATFFFTTLLFLVATFFLMRAELLWELFLGRLIAGVGVGIVSVVSPLYIAEMATPEHRGMLVSLNQLAISLGILLGYFADYFFASHGDWRWMLGLGMVPAIFLFIGLFLIPETPSFLFMKKKSKEAKKILHRIYGGREKIPEPAQISDQCLQEKGSWRALFEKGTRPALFIGIMISLFQQITGINVVIYYAPPIFEMAGFAKGSAALLGALGIGVVNFLMTMLALRFIDVRGRRFFLLLGVSGMTLSLILVALGLFIPMGFLRYVTFLSLMSYVAFFAISLGPVVWILLSEIFPSAIRGRAMGIALFVNWLANYFVSLSFLSLVAILGRGQTFILYALISLVALWFIYKKVPETKAKSLEEIQKFWRKKKELCS